MIEQIFNRRYHLEERLGDGGTAIVWAGMDALLRRRVAVKVLRLQYASDAEFVRRFYHEAESAAKLSHPNVVSIYDVGREDETYYIVMELVDGSSLAQRIEKDGALSERLTVDLTLQMCSGLGYAHRQGILHRDIKPANILLTRDDIIKISDFGIARAVERQTLVMTQQGHFLGSVAYLSPEQAQDHELKPASDLYSLGIVMYEMLTGRPPFAGETPIALALKHLSDTPAPLPLHVTPALAAIVMRLLAKDPADRYASAEDLAAALRGVRETVSTAAPKPVLATDVPVPLKLDVPNPPPRRSPLPDRPQPQTDPEPGPRSSWWLWLLVLILVFVLSAAAYLWAGRSGIGHKAPVTVPAVLGAAVADAQTTLQNAGFLTKIIPAPSDGVPPAHVIAEDPAAGSQTPGGSVITLTVSNGLPMEEVPDVVAFSADDAKRLLDAAHLTSKVNTRYDGTVAKGNVIVQNPVAHRHIRERSAVTLTVSDGPEPINVPNLVSQNVDLARSELKKLHLDLVVSDQTPSDAIPAGTIASQEPAAGTSAAAGGTVSVVVSAGAGMVQIPDLSNMKTGDAMAALQSAGFDAKLSYSVESGAAEGTVIGQNPGGGSSARHGSTVEVVVAVGGIVPDVGGMTLEEARAALTDAGYVVGNVAETQEGADGKVARTEPAAGTPLRPGESVEIYNNLGAPDAQASPG